MFLAPSCSASVLSTASFQRAETVPWTDCLRTWPGPCYGKRSQKRGWQIKTKCRFCSKQLLGEEPTAASFMILCLIPGKTHKPYLQGCWGEGKSLGPDWDGLVGDHADSQMKFFRLETKLRFLGRLWSRGTISSTMAREEDEAVQEGGLAGLTAGSSASSLKLKPTL